MLELKTTFSRVEEAMRKVNLELLIDIERANIQIVPLFIGNKVFANVSWGSAKSMTPVQTRKFLNVLSKAVAEAKNFEYNGYIVTK